MTDRKKSYRRNQTGSPVIHRLGDGQQWFWSSPIAGSSREEAKEILSRTYHSDKYNLEDWVDTRDENPTRFIFKVIRKENK